MKKYLLLILLLSGCELKCGSGRVCMDSAELVGSHMGQLNGHLCDPDQQVSTQVVGDSVLITCKCIHSGDKIHL
jgi:hypothetical protein